MNSLVGLDESSYFFFMLSHLWLSFYFLSATIDIGYKLELEKAKVD